MTAIEIRSLELPKMPVYCILQIVCNKEGTKGTVATGSLEDLNYCINPTGCVREDQHFQCQNNEYCRQALELTTFRGQLLNGVLLDEIRLKARHLQRSESVLAPRWANDECRCCDCQARRQLGSRQLLVT